MKPPILPDRPHRSSHPAGHRGRGRNRPSGRQCPSPQAPARKRLARHPCEPTAVQLGICFMPAYSPSDGSTFEPISSFNRGPTTRRLAARGSEGRLTCTPGRGILKCLFSLSDAIIMLHTSLTHFLAAAILGCPFACFAESTPLGTGTVGEVWCAVCSDFSAQSCDGRPTGDCPNDERCECFCQGAIVQAPVRHAEYDIASLSLPACLAHLPHATAGSRLSDSSIRPFSHFPPSCSGRDILALIESRLL